MFWLHLPNSVCLYDNNFCTALVPAGSLSSSPGFVALTDACSTHPQPHTTLINGKQTNKRKAINSQTFDDAILAHCFSPYNFAMPLQGIDHYEKWQHFPTPKKNKYFYGQATPETVVPADPITRPSPCSVHPLITPPMLELEGLTNKQTKTRQWTCGMINLAGKVFNFAPNPPGRKGVLHYLFKTNRTNPLLISDEVYSEMGLKWGGNKTYLTDTKFKFLTFIDIVSNC